MKIRRKNKNQKGFTLLEYCAGAAVIVGIVYGGLQAMGTGMENFFSEMGTWIGSRAGELNDQTDGTQG